MTAHSPEPSRSWQPPGGHLAWALLLTLGVFVLAHGEAFRNPYCINDDVRQQVAWMQAWLEPDAYQPGDMLVDFARHYVSHGVRWIYRAASLAVEPVLFSKLLTGVLYVALGGLLFALGRRLGDAALGWGVAAVYWCLPFFLHNISGGLARAFAGPTLALFCLGQVSRRGGVSAAALAAQALCIPYMSVLCGLTAGFHWLLDRLAGQAGAAAAAGEGQGAPFLSRPWHWGVLLACAGLVWQFNHALDAAGHGPLVGREAMENRAEFTASGRLHILPVPSVWNEAVAGPLEALLPTRELGVAGGVAVTAALGGLLLLGAWRGGREPWGWVRAQGRCWLSLAAASLLLYFLARWRLMQLFVPTRYLEYSVALAHCLLLGSCLRHWLTWRGGRGVAPALAPAQAPALAPALALAVVLLAALLGGTRLRGQGLYDYRRDAALFQAVRALPRGVLVAGHPFLLDNVLTFGRRSVFTSFELAHPWCVGLWDRLAPRLEEGFRAYYSRDLAEVATFARRHGVDFMVVDDRHFRAEFFQWPTRQVPLCQAGGFGPLEGLCRAVAGNATTPVRDALPPEYPVAPPFFEPWRSRLRERFRTDDAAPFALLDPGLPGVHIDDHLRLVDLRPLRARLTLPESTAMESP